MFYVFVLRPVEMLRIFVFEHTSGFGVLIRVDSI